MAPPVTFSFAQLEGLWDQAGGDPSLAPTAAAIALAESAGNPNSNNYTDNGGTQTSWGLWQISDGTHNMPVPNINDPLINAQQAVAKYKQHNNFKPWGTYTSKAYLQYLNGNPPAPQAVNEGSGATGAGAAAAGVGCSTKGQGLNLGIGPISAGSIGSACQLKALTGGLLTGLGVVIMLVGAVVLIQSESPQAVLARAQSRITRRQAREGVEGESTIPSESVDYDQAFGEGFTAGQSAETPGGTNRRTGRKRDEEAMTRAGVSRPSGVNTGARGAGKPRPGRLSAAAQSTALEETAAAF